MLSLSELAESLLKDFTWIFPFVFVPYSLFVAFKVFRRFLFDSEFYAGSSETDSDNPYKTEEDIHIDSKVHMTNADFIRQMNDSELTTFLSSFSPCTYCPNWSYESNKCIAPASCNSTGVIKEYLSFEGEET